MNEKLLLIRHSTVDVDPAVSAREWQLSGEGRSLAQQLAPQIAVHNPSRIITSEEPKAAETGQIIANELGLPWQTAPNLHEHEREGTPFFANKDDFVTAVTRFFHHPDKLVFGNETAIKAFERFDTAVHQLIANYPTDTLAIVTHGTVLTLFLAHYNQIDPLPFWQNINLPSYFVITLVNETIAPCRLFSN